MMVRTDPPFGRVWCRQCGYRADVLAIARSLLPECSRGFLDAVAFLAGQLGLAVPDARQLPRPDGGERRPGPVPIRGRGRRRG